MHKLKASSLCDRVCHIKRRNVGWAGSKCFIAGHMTSDQLVSELIS